MAVLTLTFADDLNASIAIGDIAYYVATTTSTGETKDFNTNIDASSGTNNSIVQIGNITSVNFGTNVITISTDLVDNEVTTSHFILFSKDNAVNMSSVLGYYAEVKMVNTSTTAAELFQISTNMFESSGHQ